MVVECARNYVFSFKCLELSVCLIFGLLIAALPHYLLPLNDRPIPYQTINAGDVVLDLTKNDEFSEEETFSSLSLLIVGCLLPLFLQIVLCQIFGVVDDAHLSLCVYCVANGLNTCVTEIVKNYVGYYRPHFYNRCEFDGDNKICGDEEGSEEARKSFPSGHASTSFCSMTILTLYLLRLFASGGLCHSRNQHRKPSQMAFRRAISVICLSPMLLAFFIASSRVVDNYHHPADVVGGAVIGYACASVIYKIWFFTLAENDDNRGIHTAARLELQTSYFQE